MTTTDANGCTATDDVTVTVFNNPIATIIQDTIQACSGEPISLNVSGGTSYSWSPATGLSDPNIANPIATPISPTLYVVTVSDANGCTATDAVFVQTNPFQGNADAGFDILICEGESANLNASGGLSYTWSPSNSLSDPNVPNPIANPLTTTIYTVTVTDASGCTQSDEVVVTVNSNMVIVSGQDTISTCFNSPVPLSAQGGVSFVWSPTTGLSNPNVSNPIATPTTSTLYIVTATDEFGCSGTDAVYVEVRSGAGSASAGSDVTICPGESAVLNATGGILYSWGPANGLSNTFSANPIASPSTTTIYTVTVTDLNSCTATDVVNVNVAPGPDIIISPDQEICLGESIGLSVSGGQSYSWSPAIGLDDPNSATPMANPVVSTTYTVTVTDINGCTNSDQVTVLISSIAGTADAGVDVDICFGNSVVLSASGGVSFAWSPASGLNNPNFGNPIASPNMTTIYTVTATDENGCTDTDQVVVNVLPAPNASVAQSNIITCVNESVQLNASGGVIYSWSPQQGLNNPNVSNPVASPIVPTVYIVTVTDVNGCTATNGVFVQPSSFEGSASAGADVTICEGDGATLNASGAVSYLWSPSIGLNNPTISNPIASPTSSMTYTLVATDINGCTATDEVLVTVRQGPSGMINLDNLEVCHGSSVNLIASGGGLQFEWGPIQGLNNPYISNPIATPDKATTYTVTVTDENGCTGTDEIFVDVKFKCGKCLCRSRCLHM